MVKIFERIIIAASRVGVEAGAQRNGARTLKNKLSA